MSAADAETQAPPDKAEAKPHVDPKRPYEQDRLPARGVLLAVAGAFATVAVAALLVWAFLCGLAWDEAPPPVIAIEATRLEPPAPRLEPTLLGNEPVVRAQGALETERYRWLDAEHTKAQVPVSRVMAILAARGWPDTEEPAR
ncbi:MAG: hypothetical protein INR68_19770 [Methylobacterium mesophilicum]|nr:hypothetical protein [Methylobacterium mesophilicum]